MSTYQYYEFQAIDRRLTATEMQEVRAYSTRARITPTSFVNDYSYGDFKGNEDAWMDKYFDALLYAANWGTRRLKLRLPARLLDAKTARPYCAGRSASVREKDGKTILSFEFEEDSGDWVDEEETQLSPLIAVRSDLATGDLRALYLGWLLCAQGGELKDGDLEPPVPAGLGQLGKPLERFAEFLRIDPGLIDAAATASAPLVVKKADGAAIRAWIARLPAVDKDDYLARLMGGDGSVLANELTLRMRRELEEGGRNAADAPVRRRTVGELLRAGEEAAAERERIAAEKAAKAKEERKRAAAHARAKHLDEIAGQEPAMWKKVHELIAAKVPKSYDQAVELLVDLRDLAARKDGGDFKRRIEALRLAHAGKRTFIARLDKAGV
jgi:hypothetical protein